MKSFGTKLWHFWTIGACFGMCFPIIAWLMTLAESSRPFSIDGVIALHQESNLFFIIDMAPFVIGVLFHVIGKYSLIKLRYLKRLSVFERELRDAQETPLQKSALRKIRVQYIKTFFIAGSTLVTMMIMLLLHFNRTNSVNKQLSGFCESVSGQIASFEVSNPEVAVQIEQSRAQFGALIESQGSWSNAAVLLVSLVILLIISLFVYSHFRVFFPSFVDLQKGLFENTVARRLIGQQAEELKKHSFANANSGTAMCTLNLNGEIEWFNDIFQTYFGEKKLELNVSFAEQFGRKFTNASTVDEIISSIKMKKEFKELVELSQEGKENTFCHFTIEPFADDDGTPLGYFVLQNDVTELVEAKRENDELLRQLQQNLRTAKVIQKNVSERRELIKEFFGDSFVVNKPLQVLSGDYIWFRRINETKALLCLGDCVGHGVAGSLLANLYAQFLDEITEEETSPDKILVQLDQRMKEHINLYGEKGLEYTCEAGLMLIDRQSREVQFAGSNTELILNDGEINMIKSERFGVGSSHFQEKPLLKTFQLKPDSWVILSSDGLKNMVNSNSQRLGRKGVSNLLNETLRPTGRAYAELVKIAIDKFNAESFQNDDILIAGVKL